MNNDFDTDPKSWLTAKELAAYFGLNEESAYRWRKELIPDTDPATQRRLIRYLGTARIYFHKACIPFLERHFESAHDGERARRKSVRATEGRAA